MIIRIKIAETPAELDGLFQVRHRVFVEEMRYFPPTKDKRLVDRFDAFPTSANIVAKVGDRVVGGVRLVDVSSVGAASDALFDFRPFYPPPPARVGNGSTLVLDVEFRKFRRLIFGLLGMDYVARRRGLTHLTAVAAPISEPIFLGSGYKPVAPRFIDETTTLSALPLILDLENMSGAFAKLVQKYSAPFKFTSLVWEFHRKGDIILRQGDPGDSAYVVVDGRVDVVVGDDPLAPGKRVRTLGPGELFGELALVTKQTRTSNVVASTDVDLIVIEREAFLAAVRSNPEVALSLLSNLGERIVTLSQMIATDINTESEPPATVRMPRLGI